MFCKNCGNEIPEGASFCNQCGTKVGENVDNSVNFQTTSKNSFNFSYILKVAGIVLAIIIAIVGIRFVVDVVSGKGAIKSTLLNAGKDYFTTSNSEEYLEKYFYFDSGYSNPFYSFNMFSSKVPSIALKDKNNKEIIQILINVVKSLDFKIKNIEIVGEDAEVEISYKLPSVAILEKKETAEFVKSIKTLDDYYNISDMDNVTKKKIVSTVNDYLKKYNSWNANDYKIEIKVTIPMIKDNGKWKIRVGKKLTSSMENSIEEYNNKWERSQSKVENFLNKIED